ncbi:MAG TPA: tandem-95 repeat protein, partial [Flavobacteriales bacterium]|nr:tandem-95 repeat protein [Flavobacteriales bacterium]
EIKPETKPEAKPETKPEIKPEVEPVAKPVAGEDQRPVEKPDQVEQPVSDQVDKLVAVDDKAEMVEEAKGQITVDVLKNDRYLGKRDKIKIVNVSKPRYGVATIEDDGLLIGYRLKMNLDAEVKDEFKYTISDDQGGLSTAAVSLLILAVNDPPVAEDDVFETEEDVPLEISPTMLLKNDKDPDSTKDLKIRSLSSKSATGAIIVKNQEGAYIYRPKPNYFGSDSFTYLVSDELGATSGAKVKITIVPVNDSPMVRNDSATVPEGVQGFVIDVLINDMDQDKDKLKLISVTQAQNGTVEIDSASGLPVYTPNENYFSRPDAPDSFSYTVSDGKGGSGEGIVKVVVTSVNDMPIVKRQGFSTDEDTPVKIILVAEDPDDDLLTYQIVKRPRKGKLSGKAPNLVYTPKENYFGPDNFTYVVNDGTSDSLEAVVKIEVKPVFDPPVFLTKPSELSGRYGTGKEVQLSIKVENPEKSKLEYKLMGLAEEVGVKLRSVLTGVNFAWLPKSDLVGKHEITISAISGDNPPVDFSFNLEIFQVNRSPILLDIESFLIDPDQEATATIRIEATDPDQDEVLTFKAVRIGGSGSKPSLGEVKLAPLEGGGTSASVDFTWTP